MAGQRAIILAGGMGTRLRPYTVTIPKPLLPIGDRPILDLVLRQLLRHGFERVTIATGHLAELIEAYCGDGSRYGLSIDYHREAAPLGTVGALASIEGLDGDFLVINGDVLTDLDYGALLERHIADNAVATIATHRRDVQIPLGVMHFDDAGDAERVTDYIEKPAYHYDASMGVYCFAPRVLEHLEPGVRLDFPDLVLRLLERGETVRAWRSAGYWLDVGQPDSYEQAQEDVARGGWPLAGLLDD